MFENIADDQLAGFLRRMAPAVLGRLKSFAASSDTNARLVQRMSEQVRQFWQQQSQPPATSVAVKPIPRVDFGPDISEILLKSDIKSLRALSPDQLQSHLAANDRDWNMMFAKSNDPRATLECVRFLVANSGVELDEAKAIELIHILDTTVGSIQAARKRRDQAMASDDESSPLEWIETNTFPSFEDLRDIMARSFIGPDRRGVTPLPDEDTTAPVALLDSSAAINEAVDILKDLFRANSSPDFSELVSLLETLISKLDASSAGLFDLGAINEATKWTQMDIQKIDLKQTKDISAGEFLRRVLGYASYKPVGFFSSPDIVRAGRVSNEEQRKVFFEHYEKFWQLIGSLNRTIVENSGPGFIDDAFIARLGFLSQQKHKNNIFQQKMIAALKT